ncbi:hypothetical protein GGX14DRAFT_608708 [Mycena pura]|uniref:Fungal N-terminal domain-containing protein n=1 Tax=Mycena pura TaxID=153505 RepID=A0AAD6VKL0_9AGAR|nr:hypothetical protein GGX14DRAFT_608708 [Mycena pura]
MSASPSTTSRHPALPIQGQNAPMTVPRTSRWDARSANWLSRSIELAKLASAGADAVPFPYIKTGFEGIVVVLQAAEKVRKNREDLHELCIDLAETAMILSLVKDKFLASPGVENSEVKSHCLQFLSVLQAIQKTVEEVQKKDKMGLGGLVKGMLKSTSISESITTHRQRISQLYTNFQLLAAVKTFVATRETNTQVQELQLLSRGTDIRVQDIQLISRDIHVQVQGIQARSNEKDGTGTRPVPLLMAESHF